MNKTDNKKAPEIIDVTKVILEFKEDIKIKLELAIEYENYIEKYKKVKVGEVRIKFLEYQTKLNKLKAEIESRITYMEYFEEHSTRNIKDGKEGKVVKMKPTKKKKK